MDVHQRENKKDLQIISVHMALTVCQLTETGGGGIYRGDFV